MRGLRLNLNGLLGGLGFCSKEAAFGVVDFFGVEDS